MALKDTLPQIKAWPRFAAHEVRTNGIRGAARALASPPHTVAKGVSRRVDRREWIGTPVWEKDWDVLLILDACRVDLIAEVCPEYDFLPSEERLQSMWSVASKSSEWLERTFSDDHAQSVSRSAYITGNCFTGKVEFSSEPALLDEVWKYAWDYDLSTIPARPITDRAISTWRGRDSSIDQMIVHYMQPHGPFINNPDIGNYGTPDDFGEGFADLWDRVGDDIDPDVAWDAYLENLRYVLDDVALVLESIDADVAISADHGNSIGEWGLYGHPSAMITPEIRRVPWITATATDLGEYSPEEYDQEPDDGDVEDRLRSLGYLE